MFRWITIKVLSEVVGKLTSVLVRAMAKICKNLTIELIILSRAKWCMHIVRGSLFNMVMFPKFFYQQFMIEDQPSEKKQVNTKVTVLDKG